MTFLSQPFNAGDDWNGNAEAAIAKFIEEKTKANSEKFPNDIKTKKHFITRWNFQEIMTFAGLHKKCKGIFINIFKENGKKRLAEENLTENEKKELEEDVKVAEERPEDFQKLYG